MALRFQNDDEIDRQMKEDRKRTFWWFAAICVFLAALFGLSDWLHGNSLRSYERELNWSFAVLFLIWLVVPVYFELRARLKEIDGKVSAIENPDHEHKREDYSTGFRLPADGENGWDRISVSPATRRCKLDYCFGGPPAFSEVLEYDLRPQYRPSMVFVRLVDMWKEDLSGDSYQVINGIICARTEERNPQDNLEKRIVWHELLGAQRYVILSAHGTDKEFFLRERERLQKALTQLTSRAQELGAIQCGAGDFIWYEASPEADEEQKSMIEAGVAALCSEKSLRQLGVSSMEVLSRNSVYVLDKLLGGWPMSRF